MKAGNINVFGWAAYDPIYGGSGAGALNDLYDRVTLLEGLVDSGFTVNDDIISLYEKAGLQRPESYGVAIFLLGILVFAKGYPITREMLDEQNRILAERRAQSK